MNDRINTSTANLVSYTSLDRAFAASMLVCGFLYLNLIKPISFGAGVSIFTAVLMVVTIFYLKKSGVVLTKESAIWAAPLSLSAMSFIIFDNWALKALNFVFLSLMYLYWVSVSSNSRVDGKLSSYIIGDLLNQILIVPFSNFICCFGAVRSGNASNRQWKGFFGALTGVLVFLPVLILVVNLLIDADAAFESVAEKIKFSISEDVFEYLLQIILGIPIACYLFGSVFGNRYKKHTGRITKGSIDKTAAGIQFAPKITVYAALTALNIIYIIFFIAGASYFFSAFSNDLPGAMTYAEYARRGFFELCAVSAINLMVTVVAIVITERENKEIGEIPKALKMEIAALCIFTLMLIITAIRKMILYIDYYGLTQLRVYTTWFMFVLFIIFIIVALRQIKTFDSARVIAVTVILGFLLLTYSNVDGNIAKYNIERFEEGTLRTIDAEALSELSDGAVPHIYELYKETRDESLRQQLAEVLAVEQATDDGDPDYEETFRDFNLQKSNADQIRALISQSEGTI